MKCLACLLLLVALLGVSAYDFKDSAFNEYLFNELQTLAEESEPNSLTHRTRRQAPSTVSQESHPHCYSPKKYKKEMHCCKGNNVQTAQLVLFKNAKKECITQLSGDIADEFFDPFDCELMSQIREKVICVSECLAKKHNSLNEAGELQRDSIIEGFKVQIGDVQWKLDAIEGYVDKCIGEVKERNVQGKKEGKPSKTSQGCSFGPLTFQRCLWREFYNGCPPDQRVETPKCIRLRERVAAGDVGFFGKHFLEKYYLNA